METQGANLDALMDFSCPHWLNSTLDVAAYFTWGRLSDAHGEIW